ncbi:MAG TPA: DsrE family protein [Candidatus Methylomirabilis sp.]|jgi:sulfur relay (sulfurtransferase) DsrF/TusC family protein
MAKSLCVLLDRGPYGSIQSGEALRHALGALGKGWDVVLALTGDAVLTALPGQSPPAGEWACLGKAVADFLQGGNGHTTVLVDEGALEARGLQARDLIQGTRPAALREIAEVLARCNRLLIF